MPAPPPAPLPLIEGFTVQERLGQGGMGEVFRCARRDGRTVAVKVLSQSLAVVPDYVKRFEREAAAMAQLDHPGIVRLLDRGRSGAHCWISMELIDGVSLRTYAHQNRPSPRMLAKLSSQVAHALAYAHARGVVHRDLKPDNVLVQADLKTKVLDFGLAGLYIQGAECLTQSNVAMGTANYMAPEQRKDAKHVDHRADLYSFGVMLYELLTGELPVGRFPAALESGAGSLLGLGSAGRALPRIGAGEASAQRARTGPRARASRRPFSFDGSGAADQAQDSRPLWHLELDGPRCLPHHAGLCRLAESDAGARRALAHFGEPGDPARGPRTGPSRPPLEAQPKGCISDRTRSGAHPRFRLC